MMRLPGLLAASVVLAGAIVAEAATARIFAGGGDKQTGPATECRLADPFAVGFDRNGNTFICEMTNNRVVKVDARGDLSLFAGTTKKGGAGDGGPATVAELNGPHHLIIDKRGDVLIADSWNWKIRRVDGKSGVITTFAGTGARGFSGDGGRADQAQFSGIYSLAFDANEENLFLADLENRRIRAINLKTMVVRTVAGNGERGVPKDGSVAVTSPLLDPRAVAVAKDGSVYILERGGHALRIVDPEGRIKTVVGTGKAGPFTPETNPLAVTLKGPKHLWMTSEQDVLIVDSDNDVIRKFLPKENRITRIIGTGKRGTRFNGDPMQLELNHPHGVMLDGKGRVYVSDSNNGRVVVVE